MTPAYESDVEPLTERTILVTRVGNRFPALIVLNRHHHNSGFISQRPAMWIFLIVDHSFRLMIQQWSRNCRMILCIGNSVTKTIEKCIFALMMHARTLRSCKNKASSLYYHYLAKSDSAFHDAMKYDHIWFITRVLQVSTFGPATFPKSSLHKLCNDHFYSLSSLYIFHILIFLLL